MIIIIYTVGRPITAYMISVRTFRLKTFSRKLIQLHRVYTFIAVNCVPASDVKSRLNGTEWPKSNLLIAKFERPNCKGRVRLVPFKVP